MLRGALSKVVLRLFVPAERVGKIIGKNGSNIQTIREETKARIRITEPPTGGFDRVMSISSRWWAREGQNNPAQAAFLRLYPDALEGYRQSDSDPVQSAARLYLLISPSQMGAFMGKGGSNINSIRKNSGATVQIVDSSGQTPLPKDCICVVSGDPSEVETAVTSIVEVLNKNPAYEPIEQLEGSGEAPPEDTDGHKEPADFPKGAVEKALVSAPDEDENEESSTVEMMIPASRAGSIFGRGAAKLKYIRRTSGAEIDVNKTANEDHERAVELTGTPRQVAIAQSLINACLAQKAEGDA